MDWPAKSEKPPLLLTNTENRRQNWRKPAIRTRHQNRKTAVFKCENRKTEQIIGRIRKTESPNAPLDKMLSNIQSTWLSRKTKSVNTK